MRCWRMVLTASRLIGGYWYAPWRSPLLRWRMETYGITDAAGRLLSADDITPMRFLSFCWAQRKSLRRFLRWSATLACLLACLSVPLPAAAGEAPSAPQQWSAADVGRHIDALSRIPESQDAAQEVIRILVAIMYQPDAATRMILFNRLRPHITPYEPATTRDQQ